MSLGRAPLLFNQKTSRRFLLCSSSELVSLSSDLSSIVSSDKRVIEPLNYLTPGGGLSRGKSCKARLWEV